MAETGRRHSELVSRVVTELRGLNFEFEAEEDAAERIIDLVAKALSSSRYRSDPEHVPVSALPAPE